MSKAKSTTVEQTKTKTEQVNKTKIEQANQTKIEQAKTKTEQVNKTKTEQNNKTKTEQAKSTNVEKVNKTIAEQNNKTKNEQMFKRIVMVTGDKGGTGKSVVARILLDIYRQHNINCIAYECDASNPQLWRHYNKVSPGVKTLKLNQRGGADALQDDLLSCSPQISLVDLPAGAAEYFESLANDIYLFQNAERLGYRITMVSVLGRVKDSVVQLKRLLEFCGNRVDYVLIRNLYWGASDKFTRYNNSKARQKALDLGAIELNLPELFDDIFDFIDSNDLSFQEALEHDALTLSNQSRLFGWVDTVKSEFMKAEIQLGLD